MIGLTDAPANDFGEERLAHAGLALEEDDGTRRGKARQEARDLDRRRRVAEE